MTSQVQERLEERRRRNVVKEIGSWFHVLIGFYTGYCRAEGWMFGGLVTHLVLLVDGCRLARRGALVRGTLAIPDTSPSALR